MTINQEIRSGTEISTERRKPSELIAEYEHKRDLLADACNAYAQSGQEFLRSASVGGAWGDARPDIASPNITIAERHLLQSAWRHFYTLYGLSDIMTASDKRKAEMLFAKPPPFTLENIRKHFGAYIGDPWGTILRGLAEVFSDLDPAYKSHEKMKIGVKGLPKRVILSRVAEYGSYGRDKLRDILNALAAYQGKPLVTYTELNLIMDDGHALEHERDIPDPNSAEFRRGDYDDATRIKTPARDVWLKTYANGNGHLYFGPTALRDINRALAEFYGDVLPDCPDERPAKARPGTGVAKDLQYYPTPVAVVERVVADIYPLKGAKVLEPSCGCGRFMDALRRAGAEVTGIEVDVSRANQARDKGHAVICMNFLEARTAYETFDHVVMNPPFYGRHYAKHVRHALKFLKPGGTLTAILPATARYDHGELDDLNPQWSDLPIGSFKESGTNINTTVATIRRAT